MRRTGFVPRKFGRNICVVSAEEAGQWRDIFTKPPSARTSRELETVDKTLASRVEFFFKLPKDQRKELYKVCRFYECAKGESLFQQGDVGNTFYVLLTGLVDINIAIAKTHNLDDLAKIAALGQNSDALDFTTVATLGPMQSFGEMALEDRDSRRKAAVVAVEDCTLIGITGGDYHSVQEEWRLHQITTHSRVLAECPILRGWPTEALESLAARASLRVYHPGDEIVKQGDDLETVFVVSKGNCSVIRRLQLPVALAARLEAVDSTMWQGSQFTMHRTTSGKAEVSVTVRDLGKFDAFGVVAAINLTAGEYQLMASTRAEVIAIDRDDLVEAISDSGVPRGTFKVACRLEMQMYPDDSALLQKLSDEYNWKLYKYALVNDGIMKRDQQRPRERRRFTVGTLPSTAPSAREYIPPHLRPRPPPRTAGHSSRSRRGKSMRMASPRARAAGPATGPAAAASASSTASSAQRTNAAGGRLSFSLPAGHPQPTAVPPATAPAAARLSTAPGLRRRPLGRVKPTTAMPASRVRHNQQQAANSGITLYPIPSPRQPTEVLLARLPATWWVGLLEEEEQAAQQKLKQRSSRRLPVKTPRQRQRGNPASDSPGTAPVSGVRKESAHRSPASVASVAGDDDSVASAVRRGGRRRHSPASLVSGAEDGDSVVLGPSRGGHRHQLSRHRKGDRSMGSTRDMLGTRNLLLALPNSPRSRGAGRPRRSPPHSKHSTPPRSRRGTMGYGFDDFAQRHMKRKRTKRQQGSTRSILSSVSRFSAANSSGSDRRPITADIQRTQLQTKQLYASFLRGTLEAGTFDVVPSLGEHDDAPQMAVFDPSPRSRFAQQGSSRSLGGASSIAGKQADKGRPHLDTTRESLHEAQTSESSGSDDEEAENEIQDAYFEIFGVTEADVLGRELTQEELDQAPDWWYKKEPPRIDV